MQIYRTVFKKSKFLSWYVSGMLGVASANKYGNKQLEYIIQHVQSHILSDSSSTIVIHH